MVKQSYNLNNTPKKARKKMGEAHTKKGKKKRRRWRGFQGLGEAWGTIKKCWRRLRSEEEGVKVKGDEGWYARKEVKKRGGGEGEEEWRV